MRRSRLSMLGCSVLGVVLYACSGAASSGESGLARTGPPSAEEQACSRDSECVLVDDCCGCANGGIRQAVRADAVEAMSGAAEAACGTRSCAEGQASQHRSCAATAAVCRGGRCIPGG